MTLKMASAQVVEKSVANNSSSQDSNYPDYLFQSRHHSIVRHQGGVNAGMNVFMAKIASKA